MVDISFVTSCYNGEEFLEGLIRDIQNQAHRNYEHIIVDSQSTDKSVEIAREAAEMDPRIHLIEQPERTPYGVSWLVGWQNAKGRIVTNSNCDDRSYPWRGNQVLMAADQASLRSDTNKFFYYGGYETRVDGKTTAKGVPPAYSEEDMSQFFRCGVHVHWDNHIRESADWDRMFKAGREYRSAFDYWLVLYFMSLGAKGVNISSCFSIYNQRADSIEQSDKGRSSFEALRAIKEFYPEGFAMQSFEAQTRVMSPDFYQRFQDFLTEFD